MAQDDKIVAAMEVVAEKVLLRHTERVQKAVEMVYALHNQYENRLERLERELPDKCDKCGRRG